MKYMSYKGKKTIPALGLGTWKAKKGEVYGAVREAIHLGYRHIDCAPAYENEVEVGAALTEMMGSGSVLREQLWVTSKLWNNAHASADVLPALQKTLADLRLDYLDLYLIHWPVALKQEVFFSRSKDDYLSLQQVPIIETWQAMEDCVKQGLVKYIGVCNFSIQKLGELLALASIAPMMNQVELHPYLQQKAMLRYCHEHEVLVTAYSPLGSSDRPRGMKKKDEPVLLGHPLIEKVAVKHGITGAQVLLSWALQRGTAAIPKSTNNGRLKENLAAQEIALDDDDMEEIGKLERGYRYVDGSFWYAPEAGYTLAALWNE
jgi:alcohol dehydrogenase (NADP+)